ncbi:hypothetical protein [Gordonia sp. (in: high G+C Gram-positive bacteria)]|uniref:hypothetical protein n=1 Tax=Gordonia sp. (in: high G+C Gram-positive bacteria) TaxID=84139 RepID=UPI003F9AA6D0
MVVFNSISDAARRMSPQVAVLAWLMGSSGAMILQAGFARRFARHTSWGFNSGWQREIAVWNLGAIVAGVGAVGQGSNAARAQLRGLVVLSALFSLNHAVAGIGSPRSWSHWVGAGANGLGIAVGLPVLVREHKRDDTVRIQ